MKASIALGFVAIAVLLATVAYQVNRLSWTPVEQRCSGLFVSAESRDQCYFDAKIEALRRENYDAIIAGNHP